MKIPEIHKMALGFQSLKKTSSRLKLPQQAKGTTEKRNPLFI